MSKAHTDLSFLLNHPEARGYTGLFKVNKKLILSVSLTMAVLSSAYSLFIYRPLYTSEASVLIKDSALTSKYLTQDAPSTTSSMSSSSVLNTMALLKSQAIGEALWNNWLSVDKSEQKRLHIHNLSDWKAYYKDGKRFLKYKNTPGTDVITLKFLWPDSKRAQQGLQVSVHAFQAESQRINQSESHDRYSFLRGQVTTVKNQLSDLRVQIANFKQTHKVSDLASELQNSSKNRTDLEYYLATASSEATNLASQAGAYRSALNMPVNEAVKAVAIGRNQSLTKLYDQLYALSEEYAQLKTRYTEESPRVQEVTSKIAQIKNDIRNESIRIGQVTGDPMKIKNVIADETRGNAVKDLLSVQAQSQGLNQKTRSLGTYLNRLNSRMHQLSEIEVKYTDLTDEESALSDALKQLEQKSLEAKIREMQTLSNVFIIDEPQLPIKPNIPSRTHMLLIGLVMSVLSGIGAAMLKDKLNKLAVESTQSVPLNGKNGYHSEVRNTGNSILTHS